MAEDNNNPNPTDPALSPAPAPTPAPTPEPSPAPAPTPLPEGQDPAPEADPAPEPVEYKFATPEGYALDAETETALKAFATSKNLTQEEAQSLVDMGAQIEQKKAEAHWAEVAKWEDAGKADKEFGGTDYNANVAVAKRALDAFGTPELKALLSSSGFGSHPEVIRAFVKVGRAVSEDKLVVRDPVSPDSNSDKPIAQRMYPKMNP